MRDFGANLADVTENDFADSATIFQLGVAPFRVDILCQIDGVEFGKAWAGSEWTLLDDGVPVRYISADLLIANKLAAGRPQDLVDAMKLREAAADDSRQK